MLLGIDHLVIAVADPDAAAAELDGAVGLSASGGGRHEAMGTHNRLVWLGDAYLELIGVWNATLAARSWIGRPALDALAAGGGFATYALATDDLAGDVAHLRDLGARWDGPTAGERQRPDGRVVRWSLATPPRLGPQEPPFLIEHDPEGAEWTSDERAARSEQVHPLGSAVRLEGVDLAAESVARSQGAYLRALGLLFRPSLVGSGAREASVGPHSVRLRAAGRGPATPRIRLVAPGAADRTVEVFGIQLAIRG